MNDVIRRKKVRVFVADDSAPVRNRLVALLGAISNLEVVGQAGEADETVAGVRASLPDVVILDIRLPGRTGIDVLNDLRKELPASKVIMLTNYPFAQYRKKCLEAGASFFFDKSSEFHKIPEAIQQLSAEQARSPKVPDDSLAQKGDPGHEQ